MKHIKLTKGKFAIVDDEDFEKLNRLKWYAHESKGEFYARRDIMRKGRVYRIYMHREIKGLNPTDKRKVDHQNHNTLDNQKENLRICSNIENSQNKKSAKNSSSKYLGVYWNNNRNKWIAQIRQNGKAMYLGGFVNDSDAALAYNQKAKELFGKFANLNII